MASIQQALRRIQPERLGRHDRNFVERLDKLCWMADPPREQRGDRLVQAASAGLHRLTHALLILEAACDQGLATRAECVEGWDELTLNLRARPGG